MTTSIRPLLIELLTEELPPKALQKLGQAFAEGLRATLDKHGLLSSECQTTPFATPRRLAVRLSHVLEQAPDQAYAERLMPVKVGLTEDGKATPALLKKLVAKGLENSDPTLLERESDGKQDYLVAHGTAPGQTLAVALQEGLDNAINSLPIPKVMRYQLADGVSTVKFVRPAHSLMALFGGDILPISALGLKAGRETLEHRFMSNGPIRLDEANAYEQTLEQSGHVIASFETRRDDIARQLQEHAERLGATLGTDPEVDALLNEVTALVEHPTVYVGEFEEQFLQVPPECLILTMRLNQKYFPLFTPDSGALTHRFLIVSNMCTSQPVNIIEGNQRVMRPRLADAQFFYETDRKVPLASRVENLGAIVYHNKLGTQLERVERVRVIARYIADCLGTDSNAADRAAMLAKADLGSNMVGEFPELQGIMGAYYAEHDGEPASVVRALRNQYRNRYDSPVTQDTVTAATLFIAERVETLMGIWGIGLAPTGERDPFGLRRAALGLISAFEQLAAGGWLKINNEGPLSLNELLQAAFNAFPAGKIPADALADVRNFIYERYRNQLIAEFDRNAVEAVITLTPPLHQVAERVRAVVAFVKQPQAASLAAANKRIGNLLKKADSEIGQVQAALLTEPAEQTLAQTIAALSPQAQAQRQAGDFAACLSTLALAREPVDTFFNNIMVMAEDPSVRANRLALLAQLHGLMNQVADISRLAQ
jgi:glycyl-tRNA synthetase beta chain